MGFLSRLGSSRFPFELATPLSATAWLVLAGVPVGIIALYFLKLRRRPVTVSSTLLWQRSLEDVRVNSLFQRLKRNLLLFLQLLAVLLVMIALLAPRIAGSASQGERFVLLIDQSASMSATDVPPSRLAQAKELATKVVRSMDGDDLAMVIAFSDKARVVSNYSGDRRLLEERIAAIEPTETSTSLREALEVAAGLANPSKQIGEGVAAASVVTPKLFIYTDGGFADVEGFSLGNLEPEVIVVGPPPPRYSGPVAENKDDAAKTARFASDNLAILALEARQDDKPDVHQLFGRVRNYRGDQAAVEAELYRHPADSVGAQGALVDAVVLEVPAQGEQAFKFDLPETGLAAYEVRLKVDDALALDNRAFAVVGPSRKARVLAVTEGDRYLADALKTPAAQSSADIAVITPDQLASAPVVRELGAGRYDLVILDGAQPKTHPEANTLYLGSFPPGPEYAKFKDVTQPIILDWDMSHPLMKYLRDLSLVYVARGRAIDLPPGARGLIDGDKGTMAFTVARGGFTDAVVTFPLMDGPGPNTTWFRYISFPLFILNAIQALGNVGEANGEAASEPGKPVSIHAETTADSITVTPPGGLAEPVARSPQGAFVYNHADQTGLYLASWPPTTVRPFAVNLLDPRESDLAPRGLVPAGTPESAAESYTIKIGYNPVASTQKPPDVRKDVWKILAVALLGVLLFEWYVYNRRVFI